MAASRLALLAFLALAGGGDVAVAQWRPTVRVSGIVDVAGPRADGQLVVSSKRGLFLVRPGGTPTPFAAGSYVAGGGEPYVALSHGSGVSGAACSFRRDDVYVLDAGARPGVVRVPASGRGATRFVDFPAGGFPSGIAFDPYGRFGYRLLVTVVVDDATTLYAIDCLGRAAVIAERAPHVEGGIVVAPPAFGRFGGDLIAPDEDTGKIYAFARDGTVGVVADPGLPAGGDRGVEALGIVPAGTGSTGYLSDLASPGAPTEGNDSLLALSGSNLRAGELVAATEAGGTTIAVRCAAACSVRHVADALASTHAEGHIVFAGRRTAALLASKPQSFAAAGGRATATLLGVYYAGNGLWRQCDAADCATGNRDWGYDSLTYTLALRHRATRDGSLLAPLSALVATAPSYPAPCSVASTCDSWSDVPEWDAIALADEYEATGDATALSKAEAAFAFVERSSVYALGACPRIPYQQPGGGANRLKTLETEANAIKAALLLYRATHEQAYLASARDAYDAARAYFLDPAVPLYSVYVFDDGTACTQVPHRFFASVNGDMIWSGVELYADTGLRSYLDQALATARAVDRDLSDGRGVFADLQAENDIGEPLVEGMDALALRGQRFARAWILRNAEAALSARAPDGSFGRFFDGPPPATTATAWQTNGGLALEIAAADLAPRTAAGGGAWSAARRVARDVAGMPATLTFRGSGIALLGSLGEQCCEPGHARVLVDGRETFDRTGIWQNKSSSGRRIDRTVLFAWRWRTSGLHTLTFEPGIENGKEGGPFLHLTGYELLR